MIKTFTLAISFLLFISLPSYSQGPQLQLSSDDISCFGDTDGEIELTISGGTNPYSYTLNGGAQQVINEPLVGWARAAGGPSNGDRANATVIDPNTGEMLVVGTFQGTATLGSFTLTSNGNSDFFFAKFDQLGNVLWANSMGGSGEDKGLGVTTDVLGNFYVTGSFSGSVNFNGQVLNSLGLEDIFLAKFNSSGTLIWVTQAGGPSDTGFGAIHVDNNGNTYLTGGFQISITLGNLVPTTLSSAGGFDSFLAKYDPNGDLLWVRHAGGFGTDRGTGVYTDASGNVYCTGDFQLSSGFGNTTVNATGGTDFFLAKYDAVGNFDWVIKAGGLSTDHSYDLTVDPSGYVVLTGSFLGSITVGSFNVSSMGQSDLFVAKFTPTGQTQWVRTGGGLGNLSGNSVTTDSRGNILVAGVFQGSMQVGNLSTNAAGGTDAFLLQLSPQGGPTALHQVGGSGNDNGYDVAAQPDGNAILVGEFSGLATVDNINLTSQGGSDLFIASFSGLKVKETITNLVAGSYNLVINDLNGQSTSGSISIAQPTQLQLSANTSNVTCNGGSDGSALAFASGGTPPYQFQWSTGQSAALATNMPVGTHILIVKDANGCEQTQNVVILEPSVLHSDITATQEIACHGDANGELEVSLTGGVPPYAYLWSNGQQTAKATNLPSGVYTATVTDANNNCAVTLTYNLIEPTPLKASGIAEDALCHNGAGGTGTVVAKGGTTPYEFFWWNEEKGDNPQNLQAGINSYELVDAHNCRFSGFVEVGNPEPLTVSVTTRPTGRFGDDNGSAKVAAAGGTPPYQYIWSNGLPGPLASGLSKGEYTVTVTDGNYCTNQVTITLREQVSVFPNPSRDFINVSMDLNGNYNYQIKLLTLDSREVYVEDIKGVSGTQEKRISVSKLHSGVYLLQVLSDNELVINQRVVIE